MSFIRTYLFSFLCLLMPSLVSRIFLMHELQVVDRPIDYFGGYLSGLGIALLLMLVVSLCSVKWQKWVLLTVVTAIICIYYANYEHIRELDNHVSIFVLHFLKDREFVQGSLLQVSNPLLLVAMVLATGIFFFGFKPQSSRSRYFNIAVIALVGIMLAAPELRHDRTVRYWRQSDLFYVNTVQIFKLIANTAFPNAGQALDPASAETGEVLPALSPEQQIELDEYFSADISGKSFLTLKTNETTSLPNVLLIIVESLAGWHLETIAGKEVDPAYQFKHLDRFAQSALVYRNFLVPSKKTNRGEYSLLCGDEPDMVTRIPKMESYVAQDNYRTCLPTILQNFGYQNLYMQAANLTFMHKDIFMLRAGFQNALGRLWFQKQYAQNGWGIDDRALYEGTLVKIDELSKSGKPWFISTLNIGTHHPGLAPEEWLKKYDTQPEAAWAYADWSLKSFLKDFYKRDASKNTLVIITTDESRAMMVGSEARRQLGKHWGSLIVKSPKTKAGVNDELFSQVDIPLSILDYIGHVDTSHPFVGRSIFRKYRKPRRAVFGTFTTDSISSYNGVDSIEECNINFENCQSYTTKPGRLFTQKLESTTSSKPSEVNFLKHFVRRNEKIEKETAKGKNIELGRADSEIELSKGRRLASIMRRYLENVPENSEIKVELDIECLEGLADFQFRHANQTTSEDEFEDIGEGDTVRVKKGDRIKLDYSFGAKNKLNQVQISIYSRSLLPRSVFKINKAIIQQLKNQIQVVDGLLSKQFKVLPAAL